MKYINRDFNANLGFGYTNSDGTFIGLSDTGYCFFFTVKSDVLDKNGGYVNCCFYTSVDYFVNKYLK